MNYFKILKSLLSIHSKLKIVKVIMLSNPPCLPDTREQPY